MFKFRKKPLSIASQMAWKLVLLSTFTLSLIHLLEIIPDPQKAAIRQKATVSETLAITSSLLAQHRRDDILKKNLNAVVKRHPEIRSARIQRADGSILCEVGDHSAHWHLKPDAPSNPLNVRVPITSGDQKWGAVQLSFADEVTFADLMGRYPLFVLGVITLVLNWIVFRWYLGRAFSYLDPSKSVPMHVRATLDTFAEGVVVLDNDKRIVLANDKFKTTVGKSEDELLGQDIDHLPWENESGESESPDWLDSEKWSEGQRIGLKKDDVQRTYLVNSSAILGNDGERRGTIASFDDITPLEEKRKELSTMLLELQSSRDALTQRNKELKHLATRDALTGCLNRRIFFEIFDKQWKMAERQDSPLSCFMVDVDHFKSVNDNHGHSTGDEVLRVVAHAIEANARESDIVCRYGGEEFCVLLPNTDTEVAWDVAERLRLAIEKLEFEKLSVTASLGVSSINLGAADPQGLLDEADKCLYVAKRSGRNQVVRWDNVPDDIEVEVSEGREDHDAEVDPDQDLSIPYPAVASLLSALAYRDSATATHSTRVAELCVMTASGLVSMRESYVLEVAALLHDIGKIGVPDAILLKPGPLTREEWETMEIHDRIGVEIVGASFSNPQLLDIVKYHHAMYGGSPDAPHLPKGKDIPVGARIVTIADAYDAMISDRVYRKGRPQEEAFEELRRCSGTQFDPELVERFIEVIKVHQPIQVAVESRQVALQVGLQIERLAAAIDERDSVSIKALATRLETTAAMGGSPKIEALAAEIKQSAGDDSDLVELLKLVTQLMSLCRSTQTAYVETHFDEAPKRPLITSAAE